MRWALASRWLRSVVAFLLAAFVFTLAPHLAQADVEIDMAPGYDLPGNDIRGFQMRDADPGLCRQACDNDNRCAAWTFVKPGHLAYYSACYLKSRLPAASVWNQNVISGAKQTNGRATPIPGAATTDFSMMFGVDLHGADLRSFAMPSGDPGKCQAACDGDGQCAAWTFIKPGPQGPPICFLKKAVPTPTGAQHVISGVKGSPRFGPYPRPAAPPPPIVAGNNNGTNNGGRPPGEQANGGITGRPGATNQGGAQGGQAGGNQGGGQQGATQGGTLGGAGGGMASGGGASGKPAGGMTGGAPNDWGVWASASGGRWKDPCAILYNAAQLANNRYDGNPGYVRVRTRATQRDADLDIDQFGLHHRNQPDGIVKLVPCDAAGSGGIAANNSGGGGASAALVNGTYDSERGRVVLSTAGGTFGAKGGTIQITKIANTVVEGTWREPGSGNCAGGANYGRFRLIFSAEGFQGYFGYCDAANTTQWGGTRLR